MEPHSDGSSAASSTVRDVQTAACAFRQNGADATKPQSSYDYVDMQSSLELDIVTDALSAGDFSLEKVRELGRGEFGVVYEGLCA